MTVLASLLHPAYELTWAPGEEIADGAQLVDGKWWYPQFGCESLQYVVDNARRQALAPEVAIPGGADPITQRGPMTTPKPLTDAAQAVYEAAHKAWVTKDDPSPIAAATIRALVTNHGTKTMGGSIILNGDAVLDIATELEGVND